MSLEVSRPVTTTNLERGVGRNLTNSNARHPGSFTALPARERQDVGGVRSGELVLRTELFERHPDCRSGLRLDPDLSVRRQVPVRRLAHIGERPAVPRAAHEATWSCAAPCAPRAEECRSRAV